MWIPFAARGAGTRIFAEQTQILADTLMTYQL